MNEFKEGQRVSFEYLGTKGTGWIRGRSVNFIHVEIWIVEIEQCDKMDKSEYPWSCLCVPNPVAI